MVEIIVGDIAARPIPSLRWVLGKNFEFFEVPH